MTFSSRNLRIGYRLGLCFTVILALMIGIAWLAVSSSRDSRQALLRVVTLSATRQADVAAMRVAIVRQDRFGQLLVSANTIEEALDHLHEIERNIAAYHAISVRFVATIETDEERAIATEIDAYEKQVAEPNEAARQSVVGFNPRMGARTLNEFVVPVHAKWLQALDRLTELQNLRTTSEIAAQSARADRVDLVVQGISMLVLLLAAVTAWRLTVGITTPLRQAVQFAAAVGNGELDAVLPPSADDEPGLLLRALKNMATDLQHADAALKRLAIEDGLTGAFNRRHFDAVLAAEHQRAARAAEHGDARAAQLALLMLDVDHFKHYNDSFGHQAGDECLKAIVAATRAAGLRPSDLLARYGGEEFVIVLPACDLDGAQVVAERVRAAVSALRLASGHEHAPFVTISIGVAVVRDARGSTAAQLIRTADEALYAAKNNGRDQVRSAICSGTEALVGVT